MLLTAPIAKPVVSRPNTKKGCADACGQEWQRSCQSMKHPFQAPQQQPNLSAYRALVLLPQHTTPQRSTKQAGAAAPTQTKRYIQNPHSSFY